MGGHLLHKNPSVHRKINFKKLSIQFSNFHNCGNSGHAIFCMATTGPLGVDQNLINSNGERKPLNQP